MEVWCWGSAGPRLGQLQHLPWDFLCYRNSVKCSHSSDAWYLLAEVGNHVLFLRSLSQYLAYPCFDPWTLVSETPYPLGTRVVTLRFQHSNSAYSCECLETRAFFFVGQSQPWMSQSMGQVKFANWGTLRGCTVSNPRSHLPCSCPCKLRPWSSAYLLLHSSLSSWLIEASNCHLWPSCVRSLQHLDGTWDPEFVFGTSCTIATRRSNFEEVPRSRDFQSSIRSWYSKTYSSDLRCSGHRFLLRWASSSWKISNPLSFAGSKFAMGGLPKN